LTAKGHQRGDGRGHGRADIAAGHHQSGHCGTGHDGSGRTRSFSASAGQMTLFLELYDGVTGDLIARAVDPQQATDYGHVRIRNSVTNRSDADRILKRWADMLGTFLERARASGAGSQ
jgi:hypothetical protein